MDVSSVRYAQDDPPTRIDSVSQKYLHEIPWEELVLLDERAFSEPILKYLHRDRILQQLDSPRCVSSGEVTLPVPDWACQLKLPLADDPTNMSPLMETDAG
jgi:hypothetical protein